MSKYLEIPYYEDRDNASSLLETWRAAGDRIVFTNGCFDILHRGHVAYLSASASLGNRLIIGLNSDSSVRRLKGPSRPIHNAVDRAFVLGALRSVDLVIAFEEDTPAELIQMVRPDILTKGGDYEASTVVGHDFVTSYGGQVVILPFVEGYSTTKIIKSY